MYGSDQMLINTALPHFTAVQIRRKFKAEERNNPSRFHKILYGSKEKLSTTKFEQHHGLIANPVYDHKSEELTDSIVDRIGSLVDALENREPLHVAEKVTTEPNVVISDPLADLFY